MADVADDDAMDAGRAPSDEEEEEDLQDGPQENTASHTVDMRAFAHRFSSIPVLIGCVFSFLPLHLLAQLPQGLCRRVSSQITRLVIDTYGRAERLFWCRLPFADAFAWGRRLTQLIAIVIRFPQPSGLPYVTGEAYAKDLIDKVAGNVIVLVEGHCEGPSAGAAAAAAGQSPHSTLESIEFNEIDLSTRFIDSDEYREVRAIGQQAAAFPRPSTLPPPSTPSRPSPASPVAAPPGRTA